MIVALVALFVALSGAAYAGITLSNNSVRSNTIVNGQVKAADLANNAVTRAKIKNDAVNSSKVANGTIEVADISTAAQAALRGNAGPAGPAGSTGATGPAGPAGPLLTTLPSGRTLTGAYTVRGTSTTPNERGGDAISFSPPLTVAPTPHMIPVGGIAPPECPGTAALPTAAPGHVCVYEGFNTNYTPTVQSPLTAFIDVAATFGLTISGFAPVAATFTSSGSWAVTAP